MFSDLVFYEVTTSLYVLWQAMRRVWRLGQNKEVNVTFLSYADTMESEILRRMGLKMKYAQLLYGKEAAGILVETDGEDDIQREIYQCCPGRQGLPQCRRGGAEAEHLLDRHRAHHAGDEIADGQSCGDQAGDCACHRAAEWERVPADALSRL